MKLILNLFIVLLLSFLSSLYAHGGDYHDHEQMSGISTHQEITRLRTGQGDFVFSWDQELTAAYPEAAKPFEIDMHGGFNEDPETGVVYTAIPGFGLCSISADLEKWNLIDDEAELKENVHGLVFFKHKGEKLLALAQNITQQILIVDLKGNILQKITRPKGNEFDYKVANKYYSGKKKVLFRATDVTYLDGRLYVVAGYSKAGDFVVTLEEKDGRWSWGKLAWGGMGDKAGKFRTAHGITAHEGHIYVANRKSYRVDQFSKNGEFIKTLNDIPKFSLVCNVAHLKEHFFFCPLRPIGNKMSTAPIYVHNGEKLISTLIPGDLKIPMLTNIHHAWPHYIPSENGEKELVLLIHGWNKGKFAVLRHEK